MYPEINYHGMVTMDVNMVQTETCSHLILTSKGGKSIIKDRQSGKTHVGIFYKLPSAGKEAKQGGCCVYSSRAMSHRSLCQIIWQSCILQPSPEANSF